MAFLRDLKNPFSNKNKSNASLTEEIDKKKFFGLDPSSRSYQDKNLKKDWNNNLSDGSFDTKHVVDMMEQAVERWICHQWEFHHKSTKFDKMKTCIDWRLVKIKQSKVKIAEIATQIDPIPSEQIIWHKSITNTGFKSMESVYKIEATSKNIIECRTNKSWVLGADLESSFNFKIPLSGIGADMKCGFKGEYTWGKEKGHIEEEEKTWSDEVKIITKPNTISHSSVVLDNLELQRDFSSEITIKGIVHVFGYENNKDDQPPFLWTWSIGEILSVAKRNNWIPEKYAPKTIAIIQDTTENNVVQPKYAKIILKGNFKIKMGVKTRHQNKDEIISSASIKNVSNQAKDSHQEDFSIKCLSIEQKETKDNEDISMGEMKKKMREELEKEMREQIMKEKMKEEMKEKMKEEIKEKMKEEMKEKMREEIMNDLRKEMQNKGRDQDQPPFY